MRFYLLLFIGVLLFQWALWSTVGFVDEDVWQKRIVTLHNDLRTWTIDVYDSAYSGHPGAPILSLGSLLYSLGVSVQYSLRAAVVILISGASVGIVWLIQNLWQKKFWWPPVLAIIISHPLYAAVSPTNAVATVLSVLIVLFAWYLYQQEDTPRYPVLFFTGVAVGLALVTRVPTAIIITLPLVILVGPRLRPRAAFFTAIVAALVAVLFDPLLWYDPMGHIGYILFRSSLNYTDVVPEHRLVLSDFVYHASFSLLSLFFGTLALFQRRIRSDRISWQFLATVIGITCIYAGVFLSVEAQSLRHFLPVIVLWDVLFVFFVFSLIQNLPSRRMASRVHVGATAFLTLIQPLLLLYAAI